ncbi:hypothetical protein [Aurantimonas sp. C2-3-R2]|uniref:hypothetical protein n=1 Tax=Aurantimonas sp. C2-3-R2 TaxID=3114363 RepID=UPI002E19857C
MFAARRFLTETVGAAPQVLVLFSLYGLPEPSIEAVHKWYSRGSIPGDWFAVLLCVLELDRGEPVRLADYLEDAKT